MSNISNRLKGLFNDYLIRLEEEKKRPTVSNYNYRPPYQSSFLNGEDEFHGIIYFYEWSDANRTPKTFYTLKAFENFLNTSQIFLASYQKELVKHIHNPYIACRKDGKDIIIKSNYESLKHELENEDRSSNPFRSPYYNNKGSEDSEPYGVQITRPPHHNNAAKVLSCSVQPPTSPKPPIQRPAIICEPEGRWDERQPELGGEWGW
jgi:hypothetical protein